jgi:hypothetical protein
VSGAVVIDPQFESAGDFSEGLAAVTDDGHRGHIGKKANIAIEPQFEDAAVEFSEGLAWVSVTRGSLMRNPGDLLFRTIFGK